MFVIENYVWVCPAWLSGPSVVVRYSSVFVKTQNKQQRQTVELLEFHLRKGELEIALSVVLQCQLLIQALYLPLYNYIIIWVGRVIYSK